jgi:hypothetical protein
MKQIYFENVMADAQALLSRYTLRLGKAPSWRSI